METKGDGDFWKNMEDAGYMWTEEEKKAGVAKKGWGETEETSGETEWMETAELEDVRWEGQSMESDAKENSDRGINSYSGIPFVGVGGLKTESSTDNLACYFADPCGTFLEQKVFVRRKTWS